MEPKFGPKTNPNASLGPKTTKSRAKNNPNRPKSMKHAQNYQVAGHRSYAIFLVVLGPKIQNQGQICLLCTFGPALVAIGLAPGS